jgi:hypothetical protein
MAVAVLALVVAMGSSAGAAKALLTGKDIKDGSITSADIAKGAIKTKHLAKQAVKGENVADGAISTKQISSSYISPTICQGGVVVVNTGCPIQPSSSAEASNVVLDGWFNGNPGGYNCYVNRIPFDTGWTSSANTWSPTRPKDLVYKGWSGTALATMSLTLDHLPDAMFVGVGFVKIRGTDEEIVPAATALVDPSPSGETPINLSYAYVGLEPGDVIQVSVNACVLAEKGESLPVVKYIDARLMST